MGRVGVLALAASVVGGVVGCKKKEEDATATSEKAEKKKKRPQGDRYVDGQRLAGGLKEWSKRWADTADLPSCESLLKVPAEAELCTTAQTALATLKAAVAKPEPEAVLVHDTAELTFATEAASEKLRTAFMEKAQAEHKAAGAPSGAPSGAKPPSAAPAFGTLHARPLGSAAKSALAEKLAGKGQEGAPAALDPDQRLLQAYSRVNRASLRYLSQFLQFGPLPMRNATFTELENLGKRKEVWPALGRTLREAAMTENDPELQGKLKALAPKLSRRNPSMMAPRTAPATPEPSAAAPAAPAKP
jgi:hypothetical protein